MNENVYYLIYSFIISLIDPDALAPCDVTRLFGLWLLFVFFVGIFLNGSIIYVYIKHKDLRSPTNAFIVSINICDLLACILEMPLPMIANFNCKYDIKQNIKQNI